MGIAATFQSLPGPLMAANYIATNAVIIPSLGRPLSGGVANTTINLVTPGTMYGERLNQLDLRFSKDFRFGGRACSGRTWTSTTSSTATPFGAVNAAYASWLAPTWILDPRLFKISAQFDF